MDTSERNWEAKSQEDLGLLAPEVIPPDLDLSAFPPLAVFAADLALCILGVEEGRGEFCSGCNCQIGFHLRGFDGGCEFCVCESVHKLCPSCGKSRQKETFGGQTECMFCLQALVKQPRIVPRKQDKMTRDYTFNTVVMEMESTRRNRAKDARMALRELSD